VSDSDAPADIQTELDAVHSGRAGLAESRDVIVADGKDSARFLQGQLTQDVGRLRVGEAAWSLLLQPNGRVVGLLRLLRTAEDRFLIDVDAGSGQHVVSALQRFLIRTQCTLTLHEGVAGCRLMASADGGSPSDTEEAWLLPCTPWPGWLLLEKSFGGSPVESPDRFSALPTASAATAEVLRVQTGQPKYGVEFTDSTIPSETGLIPWAVAFGKGCYTGQELVERIDSRGRVVRSLRRIRTNAPLTVGDKLLDAEGIERGTITSAVALPGGGSAAIALVKHDGGVGLFAHGAQVAVDELVGDH
jgi:tRNA-modifying protein YgfZ